MTATTASAATGSTAAFGVEAGLAQDRATAFLDRARLERNLALCTAFCAGRIVHLTIGKALLLAVSAAILTALGSAEVLARVESLFTLGERECLAAIAAGDLLISHKERKKRVNRVSFSSVFPD